ncbi:MULTISPECIES: hypothetical protein [Pseudomonas]|jgi:hypothetical protein|uniref:hypothetical protein n=1 Tax=Pseudomonas TaxID=286 RepID=UPI0018E7818A|nr:MULTISPECIES: hypothetical protein [Pseudomonas]MBJ2215991.1 hypothetical protein [Pseudomonas carnis]MBP5948010.1 hypothetical protein [Pseudomonas sp. P9(2020)]
MKNSIKFGLAFLAGGVVFNAPLVWSNIPNTEDVLANALAGAIQKVNQYDQQREENELAKLPNIFDCQNMQWMQNCSELNKQAKKNPSAPIRVTNAKGLEFNFVPGTPSAMMRLQLEQSPEAAKAALMFQDSSWGEYKKSAKLYQTAMWEAGPLDNLIGLDRAKALSEQPKEINTKALTMSVFVHSQCGACDIQLTTMDKIQKRYPDLKITVFQFDQNASGFKSKVTDRGLSGRMLSPAEARKALASGVDKWPTIWIDNTAQRKRDSLSGTRSLVQVEERLQGMTHITTASK